jgi:hypothetical protein
MEINHICAELLQKNRFPTPLETLAGHECKFGVFWPKIAIFEMSAPGFNLYRSQRFFIWCLWDQDQQLKHPEHAGNLI